MLNSIQTFDGRLFSMPNGYQQLTNLSIAKAFTPPVGAKYMLVTVEGEGVRYRDDGEDPTASQGMPLEPNVPFLFSNVDLSLIKFISQTPSDEGSGSDVGSDSGSGEPEPLAIINALFYQPYAPGVQ